MQNQKQCLNFYEHHLGCFQYYCFRVFITLLGTNLSLGFAAVLSVINLQGTCRKKEQHSRILRHAHQENHNHHRPHSHTIYCCVRAHALTQTTPTTRSHIIMHAFYDVLGALESHKNAHTYIYGNIWVDFSMISKFNSIFQDFVRDF